MNRIALTSDIHRNAVALEAVLADIGRRRVDEIVCLGDVAAFPRERLIRARARAGVPSGGRVGVCIRPLG